MPQRNAHSRPARAWPGIGAAGLALLLSGCTSMQSALDPQGPRADRTADLWWVTLIIGTLVYLLVLGLLGYALFRRRPDPDEAAPPGSRDGQSFVVALGVAMPAVVLAAVFVYATGVLRDVSDIPDDAAVTIEITGHQFWWEVRYPDEEIITANELHIPVGEPVRIEMTASDVIHSFWVPELSGKTDLIPGQTTDLWIQADEPGDYRGQCAEFCGKQHTNMALRVIAETPEDYAAWVAGRQEVPARPDDPDLIRGQQIFLGSACVYCHRIAGTNASGDLGPDLTHIASRRTLGAGMIENNRGNLAAWIVDAQSIKPGNKMPAMQLSGEELQLLLDYLMTLE